MADGKKSFVAYSDWDGMFQALPNEVAGKLIKHIFAYVNDRNPESDDFIINALFEQVKSTLKRDLVKWEQQREQRSLAGKKSAETRLTKINERSTSVDETERKSTVSVSVSVNNNTVRSELFEKFWDYYKKGSKKVAKERFMKLSEADIEIIRVHLPAYFKAHPDKKFRKDAERYLSNRLWENDDVKELTQKLELPKNWFNIDLEPKYWALLTPEQVKRKKLQDARRSMGV